jgi:hypothetical protein
VKADDQPILERISEQLDERTVIHTMLLESLQGMAHRASRPGVEETLDSISHEVCL